MYGATPSRRTGGMIFGIGLLLFGVLLLLDNYEVVDGSSFVNFWPLIIVAVGGVRVFQAESREERIRGAWVLFLGLWLLVSITHLFGLDFSTSWPILLTAWGISIVWKSFRHTGARNLFQESPHVPS